MGARKNKKHARFVAKPPNVRAVEGIMFWNAALFAKTYEIGRKPVGGSRYRIIGTATNEKRTWPLADRPEEWTKYVFAVRGKNKRGKSEWSDSITVTIALQEPVVPIIPRLPYAPAAKPVRPPWRLAGFRSLVVGVILCLILVGWCRNNIMKGSDAGTYAEPELPASFSFKGASFPMLDNDPGDMVPSDLASYGGTRDPLLYMGRPLAEPLYTGNSTFTPDKLMPGESKNYTVPPKCLISIRNLPGGTTLGTDWLVGSAWDEDDYRVLGLSDTNSEDASYTIVLTKVYK